MAPSTGDVSRAQALMLADIKAFDRQKGLRHVSKIHVTQLCGQRVELWEGLEMSQGGDGSTEEDEERVAQAIAKLQALRLSAQRDNKPCRVAKGLYVGGIGAARNLRALRKLRITHIVNASPVVPCFFRDAPDGLEIQYLSVALFDDPEADLLGALPGVVDFVARARRKEGRVLIHCYAGQSRSVALAAGCLLAANSALSADEAIEAVRRARPVAHPNLGFRRQLEVFAGGELGAPGDAVGEGGVPGPA